MKDCSDDEAVTNRGRLLSTQRSAATITRYRYDTKHNTISVLRNLCRILSCSICCVSEMTSRHRSALIRALWAVNAASGIISYHTHKLQTSQTACHHTMQVHFIMCEVPASGKPVFRFSEHADSQQFLANCAVCTGEPSCWNVLSVITNHWTMPGYQTASSSHSRTFSHWHKVNFCTN